MTATSTSSRPALFPVAFDLYRNIHKAIRVELFDVTALAGRVDPSDRSARVTLADRAIGVADLLVGHAEHEDGAIQPALEAHLPALAERIACDHERLDARIGELREWSADAVDAAEAAQRHAVHRLYVELSAFTGAYLEHQDVEERVVMPALETAIGVEAVVEIHKQIVGNMPPPQLAAALTLMIPAMNLDDRDELLTGMRASAPAEVFEFVWSLTASVLAPPDVAKLATRLGVS